MVRRASSRSPTEGHVMPKTVLVAVGPPFTALFAIEQFDSEAEDLLAAVRNFAAAANGVPQAGPADPHERAELSARTLGLWSDTLRRAADAFEQTYRETYALAEAAAK